MPGEEDPPRDEQGWARYEPQPEPAPEARRPVDVVASPTPSGPSRGTRLVPTVALGAVAAVVGIAALAITSLSTSPQTSSNGPDGPDGRGADGVVALAEDPAKPRVLTSDGYADLVGELERSTGDTVVFRAVLYPSYAVLDVPVDAESRRTKSLYWDGELDDIGSRGTASYDRIDLAEVQPAVLQRLLRRARARVEDPTSSYVIVEGASSVSTEAGRILAYASNEYDEGAYVAAAPNGDVVRVVTY